MQESIIRPLLLVFLTTATIGASSQPLVAQDSAAVVALATLPLPAPLRAEATVVRVRSGRPDTIRAGSNSQVCFADDPADSLLDVRCYHSAFVPLIYAARRLGARTLDDPAVDQRIRDDLRTGKLTLPTQPTAGYRVLGPLSGYHPATNTVDPEIERWQSIHSPFATSNGMGLGEDENGTEPYLMSGETWWAHVMILHPVPHP